MQVRSTTARVLITVKASPQPSAKYGDTVCVAGIRLDTEQATWVRLYPIPFRRMDGEQKFRKYDVVELEMRRATGDSRPESFRPDTESMEIVDHLEGWRKRQRVMERVTRTSTCALAATAGEEHDAPSLGMVPVASLEDIEISPHPGWSEAQQARIAASVERPTLSVFADPGSTPRPLKAPRFLVRYRYRCHAPCCPGHRGQILDWELTALQNRQHVDDQTLRASIREKFGSGMFNAERDSALFMGNFEDARKRASFSVLGVHYPPIGVAESAVLF